MSGIGVVFNPRAGGNRRDPHGPARLSRQLGDRGIVAAPRSLDELHRTAEDFRRQRVDVLGIAGGDGTNHVTLTGFERVYGEHPLPTVALLRGGTMNTVANALGLPAGRPDGLLDRLVRRYLETPTLPAIDQTLLRVEGELGFLWGLGVVPAFLDAYYASGAPSPWTAFKTLARSVGSAAVGGPFLREIMKPVRASARLELPDGRTEEWPARDWFALAAGTVPDLGLGFKPFHRAFERPGTLHMLGIQTSAMGFVLDLPRIHGARPMTPGKSVDALSRRVHVETGSAPLRYMIDGDVREWPRAGMHLEVGPVVRIATMN